MYIQSTLNAALDKAGEKITSRSWFIWDIVKILNRQLKPFGTETTWVQNSTRKEMVVDGYYEDTKDQVVVRFCVPPDHAPFKSFYQGDCWDELKFELSEIIQHESIHRYQQQRRPEDMLATPYKFGDKNSRSLCARALSKPDYYGMPDEVDAYAHDIVLELTRNKVYNKLSCYSNITKDESDILNRYLAIFGKDHMVTKKLLKKVYEYGKTCRWEE